MNKTYLHRKERILMTAVDLLAEQGINGLTMKKIAECQEVTEPAIYRHFDGKREVVKAIIQKFREYDQQIVQTIEASNADPAESIERFIEAHARYYASYPQLITIALSIDAFCYDQGLAERMRHILEERLAFIRSCVEKGCNEGFFAKSLDVKNYTEMIANQVMGDFYHWKINGGDPNFHDSIMVKTKWLLGAMTTVKDQTQDHWHS